MKRQRVLFVGLGEREVPAFEAIGALLGDSSTVQVATWLPRLAQGKVISLHTVANAEPAMRQEAARGTLVEAGIEFPDMAADFDRDWRFASRAAKSRHVLRVAAAVRTLLDDYQPEVVISSVGGETTRVVVERLCRHRGIPTAFFNAVPLGRRFALIKRMDSPFVPYAGAETSYRPGTAAAEEWDFLPATTDAVEAGTSRLLERTHLEPLARVEELLRRSRGVYPRSWLPRKATALGMAAVLRTGSQSERSPRIHGQKIVLYPLHDERDFQVAVRERHAIPQAAFLRYVSSVLPAGYRLWVKPHPEHRAAHHTLLWRGVADLSNVSFADPGLPFADAIGQCDVVLTLASTLGFEALKRGRPVVCYGSPFYSHRGLTHDVADPRTIPDALRAAVGSVPDEHRLEALEAEMTRWSWPGQFTPLDLRAANLTLLAGAVQDVRAAVSTGADTTVAPSMPGLGAGA